MFLLSVSNVNLLQPITLELGFLYSSLYSFNICFPFYQFPFDFCCCWCPFRRLWQSPSSVFVSNLPVKKAWKSPPLLPFAGVCSSCRNFAKLYGTAGFWRMCSIVFLAFTLKLPIHTRSVFWYATQFQQREHTPEKTFMKQKNCVKNKYRGKKGVFGGDMASPFWVNQPTFFLWGGGDKLNWLFCRYQAKDQI